jgi:hypothetical protein
VRRQRQATRGACLPFDQGHLFGLQADLIVPIAVDLAHQPTQLAVALPELRAPQRVKLADLLRPPVQVALIGGFIIWQEDTRLRVETPTGGWQTLVSSN